MDYPGQAANIQDRSGVHFFKFRYNLEEIEVQIRVNDWN